MQTGDELWKAIPISVIHGPSVERGWRRDLNKDEHEYTYKPIISFYTNRSDLILSLMNTPTSLSSASTQTGQILSYLILSYLNTPTSLSSASIQTGQILSYP